MPALLKFKLPGQPALTIQNSSLSLHESRQLGKPIFALLSSLRAPPTAS